MDPERGMTESLGEQRAGAGEPAREGGHGPKESEPRRLHRGPNHATGIRIRRSPSCPIGPIHAEAVATLVTLTSLGCPDTYWRLWHPGHTRCGSCTTLQDLGRSLRTSTLPLGTRTSTWCTSSTTQSLPWSSTIRYHAPRRRPSFSARVPLLRAHPMSAMRYSSTSSGVPSRTSTRIAACGTTRYFLPSNVISTAAFRKNKP